MSSLRRAVVLCAGLALAGTSAAQSPVRFAIVSDTQAWGERAINEPVVEALFDLILSQDPPVQFVVVTGDLVTGSGDPNVHFGQFLEWVDVATPLFESDMIGEKVYPVPGNHDMRGLISVDFWQELFDYLPDNGPDGQEKTTYSFDMGPCHLVMVNTDYPSSRHQVDLDWLENDLADSDQPIKLVFGHEPAFPVDGHIGSAMDKYPQFRDRFWQVLRDNGAQAYFCGHEHLYSHTIHDGTHQIINGGGGGPMIPFSLGAFFHVVIVDADQADAQVRIIDIDGQVRDAFALSDSEVEVDPEDLIGFDWIMSLLPCAFPGLAGVMSLMALGTGLLESRKLG